MNREFHTTSGAQSDVGSQKPAGIVFSFEARARLNVQLAQVSAAGSDEERLRALKDYRAELELARAEEKKRMELVEFKGEKIHWFEYEALEKLVREINEQYARQRASDPSFSYFDVLMESLDVNVVENKIVMLSLSKRKLIRIPSAVNELVYLNMLYLSDNKLRKIENLDRLVDLDFLFLDKNLITRISGLGSLKKLRALSLWKNRVKRIENLETATNLKSLYLGDNRIRRIGNLEYLSGLEVLDLGSNFIDQEAEATEIAKLNNWVKEFTI